MLRLSGMSAQTKSFAGVSEPEKPYVWYAQYLFVLHEVNASLQSTRLFGRNTKYMLLRPKGQPCAPIWVNTSVLMSVWVTAWATSAPVCGNAFVSTIESTNVDVSAGVPLFPEYCVAVLRICDPPTSLKYWRTVFSYCKSVAAVVPPL